jgi:GT2 family glycosyltransferase/glycosyltransferase involved in cell wall biosynthesis
VSAPAPTVIVPTLGGERLTRMLASLAAQTASHQTIVVDNGSRDGTVAAACEQLEDVEILRLDENQGYTRAINLGAARADGDAIVLLNDDCVCEPQFVERIAAPLDPSAGIVMAAGVMRDWRDRSLIDSAGMELDRTLLVFDYLNGEPVERLAGEVADPIGPSGAAAAFDRATFLSVGGFDERLFAYWEDVDLVLRLRRLGLRCALARDAIGDHEHSATLGSGSARKNYLMGFGRGYVLRKWQVLNARRLLPVLLREAVLCAGQAVVDRNLAGVRGRLRGYRSAPPLERYPSAAALGDGAGGGAVATLRRRAQRRSRLRGAGPAPGVDRLSTLAVFHLADTSGPSRSLETELSWLGGHGPLVTVIPEPGGRLETEMGAEGTVIALDYEALTVPVGGIRALLGEVARQWRDVRTFRALIRERRPGLVISVTTMLPAVTLAAWLERVPALVYCGELFDRGMQGGALRMHAARGLASLTARLSDVIIACSHTVAAQFEGSPARVVTVYPPVSEHYATGDGAGLRERLRLSAQAPLLASVGYLTEGRGQDFLVEAMPAILEQSPDAHYLICGDPFPRPRDLAYRDRLLALIAELGLEESVTVVGHVENVAAVYAAADVVVNPARFNEPFGRVPFEAAIAGKPSVVTRVGAIPELLRDGESALIVAPEDPAALAAAILRLLGDAELRQRLVAGAMEIVDSHLRTEHSLAGFQRAVEATLAP